MPLVEFAKRFLEPRREGSNRYPAIVILEFGGGSCNYIDRCRDFCAVPSGRIYNPQLDPPAEMLVPLFQKIKLLHPGIVSIVPNGESVDTKQDSNTPWYQVVELFKQGLIKPKQFHALDNYHAQNYHFPLMQRGHLMTPAEKMALSIAVGKNAGLDLSLTTNGSFLNADLLDLYGKMGLKSINLSYHPPRSFAQEKGNLTLEHLLKKAEEAVKADIIPTITYVLTRSNADGFVACADKILEADIFFSVGIASTRGGALSQENPNIEPTEEQVKMVFRRLLARKLLADRAVRTTYPYLLLAPYLRNWFCDQTTDFFHISIELAGSKLSPRLNVCSEVRPQETSQLENFLRGEKLDVPAYLSWRQEAKEDQNNGCKSCWHQCYFETEARDWGTLLSPDPLTAWDYWDTAGKTLRLNLTPNRYSVRPTVARREDLQNPYFWESLLQTIARQTASLADSSYWQRKFQLAGASLDDVVVASCIEDAFNPTVVADLIEREKRDFPIAHWRDENSLQSRALRGLYLFTQRSGYEAGIAFPFKFAAMLEHETSEGKFRDQIEGIIFQRERKAVKINNPSGIIYPLITQIIEFVNQWLSWNGKIVTAECYYY